MSAISAHIPGNVWKVLAEKGSMVKVGQPVVVVESMKMKMVVTAQASGRIAGLCCQPGRTGRAGDVIALLEGA